MAYKIPPRTQNHHTHQCGNVCSQYHDLMKYIKQGSIQDRHFQKGYYSVLTAFSFVFINFFSNCFFKQKRLTVKTDSACLKRRTREANILCALRFASAGGRTVDFNVLFLIYTCQKAFVSYLHVLESFCFLFTRVRKLLFLIYTCQKAFVSYLHVLESFCFLFTRARKLLFHIYTCQIAFFLIYTCQKAFVYLHVLESFCFIFTVLDSFRLLFTRAGKLLFLIYTCQKAFVSYIHVLESFCFLLTRVKKLCFLFTRARKLLFLINTCQNAFVSYLHVLESYRFLFTRCFSSVDLRKKLPSIKHQ